MKSKYARRAALAVAITLAPVASRDALAELFTFSGPIGAGQAWESGANWTADNAAPDSADVYPGESVGTNSATIALDLAGTPLGLDVTGSRTIVNLNLGDTNAAPSAITIGGAGSLTVSAINNSGGANVFDVDLALNGGGSKTFRNQVAQTLTFNGDISLSSGTAAGNLLFRQDSDASVTFLNGVIFNGAVGPAGSGTVQVRYARGTFHNTVANLYTGATQIGDNSPNNASNNILYVDGVFSTGRLIFGGGTAIKTLSGATGNGTRTIANEIQLQRDGRFAGSESFVLNGQIFQSNSRSIINDIASPATLTINGNVFTDNTGSSLNGRLLTLSGSGLTKLNGTIDDEVGDGAATRGSIRKVGTGRAVYQTPGMVAYGRGTEVFDGVLQIGTGAAPVNLNGHAVAGQLASAATTGTLEINHDGVMDFDSSLTWNVNVNHTGMGTTTFSDHSYGTGKIDVSNGKILVNGGVIAGSSQATFRSAPGGDQSIIDVVDSSVLRVGQPITGAPVDPTATTVLPTALYVAEILSPTQIAVSSNIGNTNGTNILLGNQWNLAFGAGTGTGSADVNALAGTVGGTGVIGGSLTSTLNGVIAPGASIGTLTVLGSTTIGGVLDVEYDGAGAGSIDLLAVTGSLTLDPTSVLDLDAIGAPADDPAYVLATYGALSGTFGSVLNLPVGYTVDYAFGGSSIALVQIPEPTTLVLATLLVGALAAPRRNA